MAGTKVCVADMAWLCRNARPEESISVKVVGPDGAVRESTVIEFGGAEYGIYLKVKAQDE